MQKPPNDSFNFLYPRRGVKLYRNILTVVIADMTCSNSIKMFYFLLTISFCSEIVLQGAVALCRKFQSA